MEYAGQLLNPRRILAPAVALVIGAAGAVGAYALIDDADVGVQATKVIVTKAPERSGADEKNESGVAAAIAGSRTPEFTKNEASTAAAISAGEAQAAPQTGIPSPAATAALEAQKRELRTDPQGQKALMRP
jgi:hypothetical protein